MLLTGTQRADTIRQFIDRYFVALGATADLSTDELATLVNDLDTFLEANINATNNAISAPVRAKASASTKFAALAYVALKRGGLI